MLTLDHLKNVLSYDPETGIFTWLIRPRQRVCSNVAGAMSMGYRLIGIQQQRYRAHRLAWFYMTGEWPTVEVDHINGLKDDNRWANLRLADKQKNQANSKIRVNNRSGFKGVFRFKGRRKFTARITVNYKTIWLGNFDSAEEAHEAYVTASKEHFGEFARAA